ncbi:MAG TPA: thioredoxin [Tepidisphaeraceae bacterium]|jgi:thioredoxin 2
MTAVAQLVVCPACGAKNRVSADRLAHGEAAVCGRCKAPLPSSGAAGGAVVTATDANFAQMVEQADVPVLLDLWAPWCAPCRMLAPTLEKLAGEYGGRVRIAKINVDENPAAAAKFRANSIPLLVILRNGQEVDRLVGVQPANVIKHRLDRFI